MAEKKLKDIAEMVSQFALVNARMLDCRCVEPKLKPSGLPDHLHLPNKVDTVLDKKHGILKVEIAFRLIAGYSDVDDTTSEDDAALFMGARFRLLFRFDSNTTNDPDDLIVSFGQKTAIVTGWPLWREFVLSMMGRLGLPPLVIPLLNIPGVMADSNDPKRRFQQSYTAQKKIEASASPKKTAPQKKRRK